MPYGKTLDMLFNSTLAKYHTVTPRETVPRDRSLRGKARIKARREANKK